MIKAGTYTGRVVDATIARSKEKGTPFVGLLFEITDGDSKGQRVKWEGWLSDKTAERTIESLQHCGWTGDDVGVFAGGIKEGIAANEVELVIELEPYEGTDEKYIGKSFPRVRWVNRKGSGAKLAEAMDAVQASEFGKKFKGLAMAVRAKGPKPGSSDNGGKSPTDDLPF